MSVYNYNSAIGQRDIPPPEARAYLLEGRAGLCNVADPAKPQLGEARISTRVATVGALVSISSLNELHLGMPGPSLKLSGAGTGMSAQEAKYLAIVEGLERYCACGSDDFIWATAAELGSDCVDLDTIPTCSVSELAHSNCPLVLPNKGARIRWIRGMSLDDGRPIFLPSVMVYFYMGYATNSERIALPITTGCAGHISYEQALLSAICEVIERDAVSIVWLQILGLPRITVDTLPAPLEPYWRLLDNTSADMSYVFFDATTDLGIPTIYGLQIAACDLRLTTLVACSTNLNPAVALAKVIRDLASVRIALRQPCDLPADTDDFVNVLHSGTYMARSEQHGAFQFLLLSRENRRLSDMRNLARADARQSLLTVLQILHRRNLRVYAVDLSKDEAIRSGLRVVRVIIPGLQPLSFNYRARYLGHRRLYEVPPLMGYRARCEKELNRWPQPFV